MVDEHQILDDAGAYNEIHHELYQRYRERGPDDLSEETYTDMYINDPIARRVIELPVEEALKHGFEVYEKNGRCHDVEDALHALNVIDVFRQAAFEAGIYGGSLVLIGTKGNESYDKPITPSVYGVESLRVVSKKKVKGVVYYERFLSKSYDLAVQYELNEGETSMSVHADRALKFVGSAVPCDKQRKYDYFGESRLKSLYKSLQAWRRVNDAVLQDTERSNLLVFEIKGLVAAMSTQEGQMAISNRLNSLYFATKHGGVVTIEADKESIATPNLQKKSAKDNWLALANTLAADAGMPATMLFGRAPEGLSTDDNSGRNNWYNFVAQKRKAWFGEPLQRLVDLTCKELQVGQCRVVWPPIQQPTENEIAEVRNKKAQALDKKVTALMKIHGTGLADEALLTKELNHVLERISEDNL